MSSRRYTNDGRLGNLLVLGSKLKANVAGRVSAGSLDLSTSEVSQLSLTIADPDLELLGSRLFVPGTERVKGTTMTYGDLTFECSALEVNDAAGGSLVVTGRDAGAQALRRARGHAIRKGLSPTQFAQLEARAAGLGFVGEPSAKRHVIARQGGDEPETSWDTLQRLAGELGYLCFVASGVLYFARPTWLVAQSEKQIRVAWRGRRTGDELDRMPTCRATADNPKKVASVTALVRGELGDRARPGQRFILDGIPTFDGRYMVDRVTIPLADSEPCTIDASTPINPTPEPAGGSGGSAGGSGTATSFVAAALAQAGDSYAYGAEASGSDPNPGAFDCSELVQWALARAGVKFVDGSSSQIAACKSIPVEQAIRTRGALLWHPGHIAISLGNGRTIEAANSRVGVVSYSAAGRFQRGGLVPGLTY